MLIWIQNLLFQPLSVHSEKGERSRSKRRAFLERENLQKILERKVDSAVRGERMAQQTLFEAEAEVEARNWEKRNSDFAFQAINQ